MSPHPCFARCVEEAMRLTEAEDQDDNRCTSHVARPLCANARAEPRPAFSAAHPPTLTEAATATKCAYQSIQLLRTPTSCGPLTRPNIWRMFVSVERKDIAGGRIVLGSGD
jgi:hypothetical protein